MTAAARAMITRPGVLDNPRVRRWLGDIEPAWTALTYESFNELAAEPSATNTVLRLANDLTADELVGSSVARNTLVLLHHAAQEGGLKLTATGNLARSVVAKMIDQFDWPDFDSAGAFQFHKVINEPDFLPLHFVRLVAAGARLVRQNRGFLKPTALGRDLSKEPRRRALLAILFHVAGWHCDLSFGRGLYGAWPQRDIGVVLWPLSVAARDWESPEKLTRLCAIPINGVLDAQWDTGSMAMEARILRPLLWFGLLEHRHDARPGDRYGGRHFYRKSALFDRFLRFEVEIERASSTRTDARRFRSCSNELAGGAAAVVKRQERHGPISSAHGTSRD
jgi:hypothetical protein